jgi:hypothetical protein
MNNFKEFKKYYVGGKKKLKSKDTRLSVGQFKKRKNTFIQSLFKNRSKSLKDPNELARESLLEECESD